MIYFFKPIGQPGPIKIGCSKLPQSRIYQFQIWSPTPLEMMGVVEGGWVAERWLHKRFAANRMHGEWFEASDDLLAAIDKILADGVVEIPTYAESLAFVSDTQRAERIAELRSEGWTLQAIGDEFDLTRERVRQILGKMGVKPARGMKSPKAVSWSRVNDIRRLAKKGLHLSQIADQIGDNYQNVGVVARAHGIAVSRKPHANPVNRQKLADALAAIEQEKAG